MRQIPLRPLALTATLALAAACGDDANSEPEVDAGADVGDDAADVTADVEVDTEPVVVPPVPEGTAAYFDLSVVTDGPTSDTWYDFPFPADLRLDADGTVSVADIPNPINQQLFAGLVVAADQLEGHSMVPVAWFQFDGPVVESTLDDVIQPLPNAPVLLINIDPDSPRYLELAPLVAKTLESDAYTPENLLAVGVYPGWVLDPTTQYAFVLTRDFDDAEGQELGVPEALWNMAHGASSGDETVDAAYAPLWDALDDLEVDPATVAAATVFTTGDPVVDIFDISEGLRERYDLTIDGLAIDPTDGADHPRFCELLGTMTVPEFQEGTPPFNSGGLFVFGEDGLPVEQTQTTIPVVVNLPLEEMPEGGFPLVMYFHGSGGLSSQVVDRGPDGTTGEGPAHVLAAHGMATVGSAHPVNPERLPGAASGFDYLNLSNLKAFRDTFRQGIIEQRLYLDALLDLTIDPATVAGCDGLSLPAGADAYRFDADSVMAMGQSMGGMFTNIMAPVEPRIRAVVPTGAGGLWSFFILETSLIPNAGQLVAQILQVPDLTHVHPTLHMLQMAWEPVEAFVFIPRLAFDPLPGHPVRPIYEPVGQGDSYFPTVVFDRIALAYRNQQAGDTVWGEMQDALAWRDLDGFAEYPVSNNLLSVSGDAYTGVVVQYPGDGVTNPHNIFQYYDEVKYQYGCFFETFLRTGTATVPAPAALGTPCPTE